jgi:hypothetical protein
MLLLIAVTIIKIDKPMMNYFSSFGYALCIVQLVFTRISSTESMHQLFLSKS